MSKVTTIAMVTSVFVAVCTIVLLYSKAKDNQDKPEWLQPAIEDGPSCEDYAMECIHAGKIAFTKMDMNSKEWATLDTCIIEMDVKGCEYEIQAVIRVLEYYLRDLEKVENEQHD